MKYYHWQKLTILLVITISISSSNISFSQDIKKSEFPVLGLAVGTPGPFAIIAGYHWDKYYSGISFGGGPGNKSSAVGFQLNTMYNIVQRDNFESNIGLGFGTEFVERSANSYIGVFQDINFYGLYIQLGFIYPGREANPNNFNLQLGYVYRFNK